MDEASFLTRPLGEMDHGFRAKIAENPLDQLARDVYSDYLEENGDQEEADRQRQWTHSQRWLQIYAAKLKPYDAEDGDLGKVYNLLIEELGNGELFGHGTDLHGRYELEDEDGLVKNASIVMGIRIDLNTFESFSCSC